MYYKVLAFLIKYQKNNFSTMISIFFIWRKIYNIGYAIRMYS